MQQYKIYVGLFDIILWNTYNLKFKVYDTANHKLQLHNIINRNLLLNFTFIYDWKIILRVWQIHFINKYLT